MAPPAPTEVLPGSWDIWLQTFRYPPEVLYHYTSTDALLSILTKRTMWATNLLYTSDPTDLTHGERIVQDAVDAAIAECSDDFTCKWLDGFKHTTRLQIEDNDWYSISFCTDGDLLSQWRGYGALGGGFAMGWDSLSDYPGMPLRVGITYDQELQNSVAREIVKCHVAHIAGIGWNATQGEIERLKNATGSLAVYFSLFLSGFKHPAFKAEDEFRWVYPSFDHKLPSGLSLLFRRFGSIVKPYVEVDFSRARLAEVIYGPTTDPLTPKWLRAALDANGFASTSVKASAVPMRAV